MKENLKSKTNREFIVELMTRLHPDSDLNDEEVLFGHIIDDYEQYAQVLESRDHELAQAHAEGELYGRNAKIEEIVAKATPDTDGLPDLGGANTSYSNRPFRSIFDIAHGI